MPAVTKKNKIWCSACDTERASVSGAGAHFTSPLKSRDPYSKQVVIPFGRDRRVAKLRKEMKALLNSGQASSQAADSPSNHDNAAESDGDADMQDWVDETWDPPPPPSLAPLAPPRYPSFNIPRAPKPLSRAQRLCISWDLLLPKLEEPYTQYQRASYAQRPPVISVLLCHQCIASCQIPVISQIQCLYISHFEEVRVKTCDCMPIPALLVQNGVFPMSPSQPQTAVSIDLLDVYRALFERSCDAITALAAALQTIYGRHGFHVYSTKVSNTTLSYQLVADTSLLAESQTPRQGSVPCQPPTCSPMVTVLAEAEISLFPPAPAPPTTMSAGVAEVSAIPAEPSAALVEPSVTVENSPSHVDAPPSTPLHSSDHTPASPGPPPLTPGTADRNLREQCPACFGLKEWGRPLDEGGDVQLGADGCFSYRHSRSASDGPISYDPSYFLSKEKVDKVGERIATERKKKPTKCDPGIPAEVLEACEASWDAANEKKQKVDTKCHDASGVFVLTCRHSQPLFMCNIDPPGEQQKYIVALMEEANSLLPPSATMVQAYDVGCVTDHSLDLYPILSEGFRTRVSFVINVMHSYGHQWDSRDSLGEWIEWQKVKNLVDKYTEARQVLCQCGIHVNELRQHWEEQKAAQTSIRAHAPVRLRRELDKVFALQTQIEAVEQSIHKAKKSLTTSTASPDSIKLLRRLEETHGLLCAQAEELYASLNIHEAFPKPNDLPLEFVRMLLIMRDLKINIWKRAEGSFSEWDNLDRAVGGKRESLAITKFNAYCAQLEELQPLQCNLPIPSPLSTQLNGLRNDPTLYEDVWITLSVGQIPCWLDDSDVRDGIRSLHVVDRSIEEEERPKLESTNMSNWLTQELAIVSRALDLSTDQTLELGLQQRQQHLQHLKTAWKPILGQTLRHCQSPFEIINLDLGTISDVDDSLQMQEILSDDNPEESSALEADFVKLEIKWEPLVPTVGPPQIEPQDLQWICSPTGRLNNFALNGLAAAFLNLFGEPYSPTAATTEQCAVFDTFSLTRMRYKASDDELWRNIHHTKFWSKDIWLIPIHRPKYEHCVLAIVYACKQKLGFFDSLGHKTNWQQDLLDVMVLITHLIVLANRHDPSLHISTEEVWTAHPLFHPLGLSLY
ncbi:hypothetical protein B0H19DRAFT_1082031 [Mycena capillaripes]|nr:hypothetical protein B0H19DRAFT_1082031 [Mycena capillaripes]